MNINRSKSIQCLLCTLSTIAAFLAVGLAPPLLRLTHRTQQCNRTRRSYILSKMVRFFGPPCIMPSTAAVWALNQHTSRQWCSEIPNARRCVRCLSRGFASRGRVVVVALSLVVYSGDIRSPHAAAISFNCTTDLRAPVVHSNDVLGHR